MAASKLAIKLTARFIRKWSGRWTLEQHGRLEILDQETAGGKSKEREATLLSRLKIFSLFPFFFLSDIFRSQVFYLHFPEFANSLLDIFFILLYLLHAFRWYSLINSNVNSTNVMGLCEEVQYEVVNCDYMFRLKLAIIKSVPDISA